MGIVYQKHKQSGITYVYENKAYWDKEKQQSRARRKLIGKLDPKTGEIIPTRSQKRAEDSKQTTNKRGPAPIIKTRRRFFGATHLLDEIGKTTGVESDLKACFPDTYKKILSIAYFLILESNGSLSRFPHWQRLHVHPFGEDLPSQRSSELFQSISEDARMAFFTKQGRRRMGQEFWAFDITSISSYSEALSQVKKGRNKEHDRLPQINLALLFGEQSGLPFYYRKLPGNISDVKTVRALMGEFDAMGYKKTNILLDRGFYSRENINHLFTHHQKFIIGVKLSLNFVRNALEAERDTLGVWSNLHPDFGVYGIMHAITWDYERVRPYKKDVVKETRRAYLHLFYDPEKAASDQLAMNDRLSALHEELLNGERKSYHEKDYERYFTVRETPKRGIRVEPKEDAMAKSARDHGYYALLSNTVKDPFEALSLYRSKDIVEKGFGNLKDRLSLRRMRVSSELSLNGKLFVQFIALIYLSYVKKRMQEGGLFKKWTLQGLLDELDTIERFEAPGHGRITGEVTKKQDAIYETMGVKPPSL
jgi:transposase